MVGSYFSSFEFPLIHTKPLAPPVEGDASLPYDIANLRNYSLAISGDVFRWVIDYASSDVLQRVGSRQ
jgi:cation-transporting ATPase 13A2